MSTPRQEVEERYPELAPGRKADPAQDAAICRRAIRLGEALERGNAEMKAREAAKAA